jgi:hypothetical protein
MTEPVLPTVTKTTSKDLTRELLRSVQELGSACKAFQITVTCWMDNETYVHVNNMVYRNWFNKTVKTYLFQQAVLDVQRGHTIGLPVETPSNDFFATGVSTGCSRGLMRRPVALPESFEHVLEKLL